MLVISLLINGMVPARTINTPRNEIAGTTSWLFATLPSSRSLRRRSGVGSSVFSPVPPSAMLFFHLAGEQGDRLLDFLQRPHGELFHASQKRSQGHHDHDDPGHRFDRHGHKI